MFLKAQALNLSLTASVGIGGIGGAVYFSKKSTNSTQPVTRMAGVGHEYENGSDGVNLMSDLSNLLNINLNEVGGIASAIKKVGGLGNLGDLGDLDKISNLNSDEDEGGEWVGEEENEEEFGDADEENEEEEQGEDEGANKNLGQEENKEGEKQVKEVITTQEKDGENTEQTTPKKEDLEEGENQKDLTKNTEEEGEQQSKDEEVKTVVDSKETEDKDKKDETEKEGDKEIIQTEKTETSDGAGQDELTNKPKDVETPNTGGDDEETPSDVMDDATKNAMKGIVSTKNIKSDAGGDINDTDGEVLLEDEDESKDMKTKPDGTGENQEQEGITDPQDGQQNNVINEGGGDDEGSQGDVADIKEPVSEVGKQNLADGSDKSGEKDNLGSENNGETDLSDQVLSETDKQGKEGIQGDKGDSGSSSQTHIEQAASGDGVKIIQPPSTKGDGSSNSDVGESGTGVSGSAGSTETQIGTSTGKGTKGNSSEKAGSSSSSSSTVGESDLGKTDVVETEEEIVTEETESDEETGETDVGEADVTEVETADDLINENDESSTNGTDLSGLITTLGNAVSGA